MFPDKFPDMCPEMFPEMFPVASGGVAVRRFLMLTLLSALVLAASLTARAQEVSSGSFRLRGSAAARPLPEGSWRFIASGDSRNCGDVVMPAIAANSVQFSPSFYWHLGDLRAIYKIDEDMAFAAANDGNFLSCSLYLPRAWPDFIDHQIAAFGNVPFYVGIGNHETIPPKDKIQFRRQFAAWLDQPTLHDQRVKDEAAQSSPLRNDKKTKKKDDEPSEPPLPQTYFHWIQKGVDFIYLDNASDCFPESQLTWLDGVLQRDTSDKDVKSIVVGMHESLPDSVPNKHSMGDSKMPGARESGEKAYDKLLAFHTQTTKPVYVLSSHSHFYLENIFDTEELRKKGRPLARMDRRHRRSRALRATRAAVRHCEEGRLRLPDRHRGSGWDDSVCVSGSPRTGCAAQVRRDYPQTLVHWCFAHNSKNTDPGAGDITPRCLPPLPPDSPPPKCE